MLIYVRNHSQHVGIRVQLNRLSNQYATEILKDPPITIQGDNPHLSLRGTLFCSSVRRYLCISRFLPMRELTYLINVHPRKTEIYFHKPHRLHCRCIIGGFVYGGHLRVNAGSRAKFVRAIR